MRSHNGTSHSVQSASLADVLDRILDKGMVIVGDIKIKLVDIELLTIQIRLLIASVDKARELGIDWWSNNGDLTSRKQPAEVEKAEWSRLAERVQQLEAQLAQPAQPVAVSD